MIKGKTSSGFAYELPENAIDNMELIDALAETTENNPMAVSRVCRLFLGEGLRKRLYDYLRTEDGRVPIEALSNELGEMFASYGEAGKKSKSSPA